ncbi:hypothetical protein ACM562_13545 [Streptomyces xantholiticus]
MGDGKDRDAGLADRLELVDGVASRYGGGDVLAVAEGAEHVVEDEEIGAQCHEVVVDALPVAWLTGVLHGKTVTESLGTAP